MSLKSLLVFFKSIVTKGGSVGYFAVNSPGEVAALTLTLKDPDRGS